MYSYFIKQQNILSDYNLFIFNKLYRIYFEYIIIIQKTLKSFKNFNKNKRLCTHISLSRRIY